MDFIVKGFTDEVTSRVKSCVNLVYERYMMMSTSERRTLSVMIGSQTKSFPYDNVCFIETSGREHRLILHTLTGKEEFRGSMGEVEASNPDFVRCHRTYLVNLENAKKYDEQQRMLLMKNGENCHVATRKESAIKRRLKKRQSQAW
jgi:two-component system response regulator AgrA